MKTQAISKRIQRLENLFSQANNFKENLEILSHWSKYLCVLVSGLLETSIQTLLINYAVSKSNENVANFVSAKLDSFQNAKTGKILELARSFNEEWAKQLEGSIVDELKDSIETIVNNRHKIAHGEDVTITFDAVRRHYKNIVRVIEIIESLVL